MKKQTSHKKSKDAPVKAKKAAPKKAAKKAAKKPETKEEEVVEDEKVEAPKTEPQPETQAQQPESPQPTPEPIAQAPADEATERITTSDQQKLLFKYGARIDNTDLSGTKDEVLNKVFKKTGDSVEDIRKYLEG